MNLPHDPTIELPRHKPVLVDEVLEYLAPKPGKVYLDVTFGSGGHTRAILESEPRCTVIAMDWDETALENYGTPLQEEFGERLSFLWGNFSLLYKILKNNHVGKVDGILADFGTSQIQIHYRAGFSVFNDTPLDMRMSPPHQSVTAEHVISKSSEEKLREIFWQLGEESFAKDIARAIVKARNNIRGGIKTTKQLAEVIEKAVPRSRKSKIHPATRVFQALRIYVNHELDNIQAFLPAALEALKPGGRLVCISFHSLEDRLVKTYIKEQEKEGKLENLTPKVIEATELERKSNPSSRSAKLRSAQKI